jgi:hypothetical protein
LLDTRFFLIEGFAPEPWGKNEMGGVCGREPWRTLQNHREGSSAIAMPWNKKPKGLVNSGFLGFRDASRKRKLCISYPPRNFLKTGPSEIDQIGLILVRSRRLFLTTLWHIRCCVSK